MEVLLALLAIISVIVRISKKAQETQGNQNQPQRPVAPKPKGFDFEKLEEMLTGEKQAEKSFEGVNRPNAEGYRQEKKPEKKPEKKMEASFVSAEGSESSEGKCIEENANHCAVEHEADSVYASEITDERTPAFTRDDMVKGIIMAEILSKPKCME